MHYAVVEFGEFAGIPAVGGAHQVAGDALQFVDVVAVAVRTFGEMVGCVFVAAVHTAVAVVVHRAVAYVVFVHQVHHMGNGFGIVGGIAVNFHIEDVAAAGEVVVGCFHFCLVLGAAFVVHGHVVGVGVVGLVGHAGHFAEFFAVALGKFAAQAFGRCGENAVVVLILLRKTHRSVAHIGHDFQSQFLGFFAFAVMLADEGN